ncbi:MAG: sigma-54-dependent Fis family transcriptional regulator [Planctomycetes bacterium]|nr:sigma-54-dependent Fis family transcriptional regulator [Planctomycetota bacterium]
MIPPDVDGVAPLPEPLPEDLRQAFDRVLEGAKERGLVAPLAAHARRALAAAVAPSGSPSAEVSGRYGMVGSSPPMLELYGMIEKVAAAGVPVLIQGETGTGKELVARALHDASPRSGGPFLAENCAAISENLLESELFGHKKGAFTGAVADRPGHFVAADKGTVFLDEIGDMPLSMQAKLLRVLQDGEVRAVGANTTRRVDVRIIAATHRDLPAAVASGDFREDLLFRLNVVTLHLPPLRERGEDVRAIARALLPAIAEEVGREATITEEGLAALAGWSWPGNVRELENELRRAVALSSGAIGPDDLSPRILAG